MSNKDAILEDVRIARLIDNFPDVYQKIAQRFDLTVSGSSSTTSSPTSGTLTSTSTGNIHRCKNSVFIIKKIPREGLVIDQPGKYVLARDICWKPALSDSIAINITTDNVILDLNHKTLCQRSGSSGSVTTGILVSDSSHVVVKNGGVKNMGLIGVQCELCFDIKVINVTVSGISANNIIDGIVPIGIYFRLCLNALCCRSTVRDLNVRVGTMAGIQFTLCAVSHIRDCLVKNLVNRDGACTGVGHALCIDATTEKTKISNLQSFFNGNLNTQGHTCIGFIPIISAGLCFKNCCVNCIKGTCDDAHGMSMFVVEDVKILNSRVSDVVDGLGNNTGAKATGIELYANNVLVKNCHVKNIKAIVPQDLQAAGFSVAGSNVKFCCCSARNVKVCGPGNQDLGYGMGFGWAPDPRPLFRNILAENVFYKNCQACCCQVGFDTWNHVDSVWKNITSNKNGISILQDFERTLRCNPCSECNPPIVITLFNQSQNNTFKLC